jgi:ubiquinone biosynthesis protein UbiJ
VCAPDFFRARHRFQDFFTEPAVIDQLASSAAVAVLNHLLAREAWARDRLAPFAGRSARFELPPFAVHLRVMEAGLLAAADGTADVTITLDAAALPRALADPQAVLRNVKLSGDAEFAQGLSFVLQNLRPEPEEELARFVGDAAAVRVVGLMRQALAQLRSGGERLASTTVDYLVAENPMLVARPEAEVFTRDVAALRDAVARLDKRVALLERAAPPPAERG